MRQIRRPKWMLIITLITTIALIAACGTTQGNQADTDGTKPGTTTDPPATETEPSAASDPAQLEANTDPAAVLAGVLAAVDVVDSAGFHGMAETIENGELDPGYLGTVTDVSTVLNATQWPEPLTPSLTAFRNDLATLAEALQVNDIEAARAPAGSLHSTQHAFSEDVVEWLGTLESPPEPGSDTARLAAILAGQDLIDSSGFHPMSEAIQEGDIEPRFLSTTEKALAVSRVLPWPENLKANAASFEEDASTLARALEANDQEQTQKAAIAIHESQHHLSTAATEWYGNTAALCPPEDSITQVALTVAAMDPINQAGFHHMSERLAEGELNPRDLGTVQDALAIARNVPWDDDVSDPATVMTADLMRAEEALAKNDVEEAAHWLEMLHESQHHFKNNIYRYLGRYRGAEPVPLGDTASYETPEIPEGAQEVTITLDDWRFVPDPIEVKTGTAAFTLKNEGNMPHGLFQEELGINTRVPAGETRVIVVDIDQEGRYQILCNNPMCGTAEQHENMTGKIIAGS